MVGSSPIFTSILVLFSLFKTPEPPTKNTTTASSPTPSTSLFNAILSTIVETPTFRRRVKLFSKTGFHLVMLPGGNLKGSLSSEVVKTHGIFELQSFGSGIIRIKNMAHQRYIAIAPNGKVHSTVNATSDTILREIQRENTYNSFSSYVYHGKGRYKNWYIAIKQNGQVKNAGRVLWHHKSHQFQVMDPNNTTPKPNIIKRFPLPPGVGKITTKG